MHICRNKSQRKMWVTILRTVIITAKHIEQKKIINNLYNGIPHTNSNYLYSTLVPYLFYCTFPIFKKIYTKYDKLNKIITEMENTKTILLALTTKSLN